MQPLEILLIVGEVLFFVGKDFFHKRFSLSHADRPAVITPIFNLMMGIVTALGTFVYAGFRFQPDVPTLIVGILSGISLFAYYYAATNAAQTGSYSLQSMMSQFGNILVPLLAAVSFWGDRPSVQQYVGIALMLAAFFIFHAKDLHSPGGKSGGFRWFLLLFLVNGAYSTINDVHHRIPTTGSRMDVIITCFLTLALFSAFFCIKIPADERRQALKMSRTSALNLIFSCLCGVLAINFMMAALACVPSYLLYPIGGGAMLIVNTLLSCTALHESLKPNQYIGIAVAVAAIVLSSC